MRIKLSKNQWEKIGQMGGWFHNNTRKQEMLRFDFDARIEIVVEPSDLEMEDAYSAILQDPTSKQDEKIQKLKELALQVAQQKLTDKEVSIDENNLNIQSINMDTVDWETIVNPEPEEEDEGEAAETPPKPVVPPNPVVPEQTPKTI